jgi:ribosome-associated translation inhibitor RaiA
MPPESVNAMQSTQITLRNLRRSTVLHGRIQQLREHLERYHPDILSCRVAIEDAGRRAEGRQFGVHLTVHIPGREIVVTRSHNEDVYLALRDAFQIVRRELLDASGLRVGRPRGRGTRSQAQ